MYFLFLKKVKYTYLLGLFLRGASMAMSDDNQKQILSQFINIFNTIFIKGLFGEGKREEGGNPADRIFFKKKYLEEFR